MGNVYWSPLSIFVSLNKELESGGGGGTKIHVLVLPVGGGFENSTCLKRGATNTYYNCRVSPQPPPCTINNERSLSQSVNEANPLTIFFLWQTLVHLRGV